MTGNNRYWIIGTTAALGLALAPLSPSAAPKKEAGPRVEVGELAWVSQAAIGGDRAVDVVGFPGGGVLVLDSTSKQKIFEHAGSKTCCGGGFVRFEPHYRRFRAPTGLMTQALGVLLCEDPPPAAKRAKPICTVHYLWQTGTSIALLGPDFIPVQPVPFPQPSK